MKTRKERKQTRPSANKVFLFFWRNKRGSVPTRCEVRVPATDFLRLLAWAPIYRRKKRLLKKTAFFVHALSSEPSADPPYLCRLLQNRIVS